MWDFPVKEGVSFQNANRVHPLMQARVEKLIHHLLGDKNVKEQCFLGVLWNFGAAAAVI